MKKMHIMALCISVLMLCSGLSLAAEEQQESPSFVQELVSNLRERGWNQEEIDRFTAQARELSWEGTERADAQLVAYALSYSRENQSEEQFEQGLNRARLALELAGSTMEMERMGVDRTSVAQSAVRGVRSAISQSKIPGEGQKDGNPGELIRKAVRESQRNSEAHQARDEARGLKDNPAQGGRPDDAGPPSIPK